MTNNTVHLFLLTYLISLFLSAEVYASSVQQSMQVQKNTLQQAQENHRQVVSLDKETEQLLNEYQQLMQRSDYQEAYNAELKIRLDEQQKEITKAQQELVDLQITRLHIVPFLREKAADLKRFIELDLPFEQEERLRAVSQLENLLASSKATLAEKYRRVMELWQTESDYSYNLATYRGEVEFEGDMLSVSFLRVGRMALYWQTQDGKRGAYWQASENQWQALNSADLSSLRLAMRVADKQMAPQLLSLPVYYTEVK